MKKFSRLLLFAFAALMVVSCGKKYEIAVSPSNHDFGYEGGTLDVEITTQGDWTVKSSPDWVSLSANSGSKDASVVVTATPNTGESTREGLVEFVTETHSAMLRLKQDVCVTPFVLLNPDSLHVSYSGGAFQVAVASNCAWRVSMLPDWVKASVETGQGNGTIVFNIEPNLSNDDNGQRSATVFVAGAENCLSALKIIQDNTAGTGVTVDSLSLHFGCESAEYSLSVTCPVSWNVTSVDEWITLDVAEGSGNGQVKVSVDANEEYERRRGFVSFITETSVVTVVSVFQEGTINPHYLTVDPMSVSVSNQGGTQRVSVSCDEEWQVVTEVDWITLSSNQGVGDMEYSFEVEPNVFVGVRSTNVVFESKNKRVRLLVEQASGTVVPMATLNPDTLLLPAQEGVATISVSSNTDWELRSDAAWVVLTPTSGTNDAQAEVRYLANGLDSERRCLIEVFVNNEQTDAIVVKQAPIEYYLSVDITEVGIPGAGDKFAVQIESNQGWAVASQDSWARPDTESGEGNFSMGVEVSPNLISSDRETVISVKGDHNGLVNIIVRQAH